MNSKTIRALGRYIKPSIFEKGTGALLPESYKKFYKEWKLTQPTAVHWIAEKGKWKRDPVTGEVHPIQNIPIPSLYIKESNYQLWGGEDVVQGFQIRGKYKRRVPHFWMPNLKRSVIYSEILNKHISVILTERTINLINENYGFDHYILKTPACDIKSLMALGLKRKILQDLEKGCPIYEDQSEKQREIYQKYKNYLSAYTSEDIEWYGYSFNEACKKLQKSIEAQSKPTPLKHVYRARLIETLKETKILEKENVEVRPSWLKKMNPFGQKHDP